MFVRPRPPKWARAWPGLAHNAGARSVSCEKMIATSRRWSSTVRQTQSPLELGQPKEAQAAAVVGGVWSDKALAIGNALATVEADAEAHAARLSAETLALETALLRRTFDVFDLPVPQATMRALAAAGEPLAVGEDVSSADRERVGRALSAERRRRGGGPAPATARTRAAREPNRGAWSRSREALRDLRGLDRGPAPADPHL